MSRDYLDFDVAVTREGQGYAAHVLASPAGEASAPFTLPFAATDLAQFMIAVGPPRVSSRRLVPAEARVVDVKEYGRRLGDALLSGEVGRAFRDSLTTATGQGKDLRLRLRLDAVPDLDPVPWEYLYDSRLGRFLTLSQETPIVRLLDSLERPPVVHVDAPLRVLVMISSPSDMPELAVDRERQLLTATTGDLVASGRLTVTVLEDATLTGLQRALLDDFHVFHFIGHGGFDQQAQEGVLVLEREDGTAHRVSGARLGTLLHDARTMQLAVLNACEGARTSGRDAFSGVGQALVRQGLPAVVAMQTEISDRAALVFSHEFYYFLTRGLGIDAAICEVRKAMAVSDEASEWGTAVLLRSGADQPFSFTASAGVATERPESRLESLYDAAKGALLARAPATALPLLEQIAAEHPDYQDVTQLLERVRPEAAPVDDGPVPRPRPETDTQGGRTPPPTEPDTDTDTDTDTDSHDTHDTNTNTNTNTDNDNDNGRGRRGNGFVRSLIGLVVLFGLFWLGATQVPKWFKGATADVTSACGPAPAAASSAATTFVAGCATTTPAVDGDFADWDGVPSHSIPHVIAQQGTPQREFGGDWQVVWDSTALYLRVHVVDPDVRSVNLATPGAWFNGDGFSFEFGPDARSLDPAATTRRGQDVHVMVGLSRDAPTSGVASINPAGRGTFTTGTRHPEITVGRADTLTGYDLEARVPWSSLQLKKAPVRGSVFSMNVNLSDATSAPAAWKLRTMKSTNAARTAETQGFPHGWQTITLADEAS
ncbi:CHAT domain-containing protein [Terrabacter sp. LjRoot27]|uniref:CHAT domain-containing protein n=1 Tax=Terrabacter sp. LjRoot27 TaxID=3342306 RepID=UPI003ECE7272